MGLHIHREPLTSDIIFKAVFGRDTPGSKRALIALLNRILERNEDPIVALDYQNPFSIGELEEEKEIIMDILVETSRGEQIDIEMQISTTKELMNRFLYYLSKLVVRGLEKGENYDKLKKSIVIVILKDSCLPESEPAHSCFVLKNQRTGYELSEMAQLHILELGKYNWRGKKAEELSPLEVLSAYMNSTGEPGQEAYVERLLETGDEVIAMADEELKKVSEDDRLFAYRMSREMYKMQEAILMREVKEVREEKQKAKELGYAEGHAKGHAEGHAEGILEGHAEGLAEGILEGHAEGLAEGIAEGRAEGLTEGRKDEKLNIARRLKAKNMRLEEILEITGLTLEEIEKI